MELLNLILTLILLVLSIPIGFLIAYMARDELVEGKKWFITLTLLSLIIGIFFLILQSYAGALACFFIFIVSLISYRKSFDKKWVKKAFK